MNSASSREGSTPSRPWRAPSFEEKPQSLRRHSLELMGLLAGSEITPLFLKYFCGYLKTERGLADVSSQALKNDSKQEKGMPSGHPFFSVAIRS
jgi:hypothetical protein